jgi:hypothetical protein
MQSDRSEIGVVNDRSKINCSRSNSYALQEASSEISRYVIANTNHKNEVQKCYCISALGTQRPKLPELLELTHTFHVYDLHSSDKLNHESACCLFYTIKRWITRRTVELFVIELSDGRKDVHTSTTQKWPESLDQPKFIRTTSNMFTLWIYEPSGCKFSQMKMECKTIFCYYDKTGVVLLPFIDRQHAEWDLHTLDSGYII